MNYSALKSGDKGQFVTFRLGPEIYGIDIFKVQEVLHYRPITVIPNAPKSVEGVIQIRDRVIPVVDLKKRFGMGDENPKKRRIIVLSLDGRPLGVIVDEIYRVLNIEDSSCEDLPDAVLDDNAGSCVSRLAKTEDALVILITPELILNGREKAALNLMEEMPKGE